MYLNYLQKTQWKHLQYLLQMRQLQLLRRHVNIGAKPPIQTARLLSVRKLSKLIKRNHEDNTLQIRLKEAKTSEKLLELLESSVSLETSHVVEGISLLWQQYQDVEQLSRGGITERLIMSVLPILAPCIEQINVDDLSRCYLYLRKMHVPNSEPVVEAVLIKALSLIEKQVNVAIIPLTSLSRLSVGINLERDFFTPLVCRNFVPHLEHHIYQCYTEEQVRLLSTCLFQLHFLINEDLLAQFKTRVAELIQNNVLSSKTPKALLKLLHMLNIPLWSQQHTQLIRKVMLVLQPCIHEMEPGDLKSMCRAFLHHQEPSAIKEPLRVATEKLLENEKTADALSCAVPFATPHQREKYTQVFKELLFSKEAWLMPNASGHFFSVLRALKISDLGICNLYWSGVIRELESCGEEQTHLRFLRHCQRYMNFNNNLGGTYRHFELERILSRLCMGAIEEDIAGRLPSKFARLASFVLAYGRTPLDWKKFPNILLSKMLAMAPQFGIQDCFLLSRGMQIACELRFRQNLPSLAGMQLSTMDSILTGCAERHLAGSEKVQVNASELSMIVRTLSHRKTLKNTLVYNQALLHYKSIQCNDLNSRVVRDMAYNFNASNFCIPELLESMFSYVSKQNEHITGETVEKVLTCSYNLGYTPENIEVLNHASRILLRDFEQMSGLSIVQACLALCFYKTIPEQLINQVFCVKFIQRIEEEIQLCYSKATYPERVLNLVMQLNRTVCLDFPEANVPWFQQNYIEAHISKRSFLPSGSFVEVKQLLQKLLQNDNNFRCNHTTPYGYQIDFVIHFDRDRKPIPPPPVEATMLDRITKVAILLLKLDSFCENDITALRGPESLKMRHLEMMGYKVMQINQHDWNSKYMTSTTAKANYLKCLLQISH
ncbi:FAST kinase domain-containing protein 1, mitochondrial [Drosophila eugracilis]|uniref:FAST kinase domain-containing protein 1, mitochondrial n=1 Tax=Drosophila eugracilis TaxID=29029 RepID=UPI001BDAB157|nr:FAST kinase domain-containing protein 1, mitochondrial [Drosophila eugracilis]